MQARVPSPLPSTNSQRLKLRLRANPLSTALKRHAIFSGMLEEGIELVISSGVGFWRPFPSIWFDLKIQKRGRVLDLAGEANLHQGGSRGLESDLM